MRDKPNDLNFDSIVEDVCFHPLKDVIAAASIDGDVAIYSYSVKEDNHQLLSLGHHKKGCRAVRFTPTGESLYSVSKDKSLQVVDLDQGVVKHCIKKAHPSAIYSLYVVDENIVITGDDDGRVKVWDLRRQASVMDLKENDEFISDMVLDNNKRLLLASSGDGTLSAFDIRKHKMKLQSELFDSELLSLASVKREKKLVCGTGEGVLNIFNWGEWGNLSDRFPGHPASVDCMVPITEDIICTGSIDGIIRAVHILPNRLIGVVGEHEDFPVENLSKSHCGRFLASCSHDQKIKFWNIEELPRVEIEASKKGLKFKNKQTAAFGKDDFFSDLMENEDKKGDGSDDNSSGDDEEGSDFDAETAKHSNENGSDKNCGITDESDEELDNGDDGADTSNLSDGADTSNLSDSADSGNSDSNS